MSLLGLQDDCIGSDFERFSLFFLFRRFFLQVFERHRLCIGLGSIDGKQQRQVSSFPLTIR